LLFTQTDDELPEVFAHIANICELTGAELVTPKGPRLYELIENFNALPNRHQRWCTRMIKIQPCIAYLKANPGTVLAVGLRADEPAREGMYGDYATYRYPLREWKWGVREVVGYNTARGITVPKRTDCALCFWQRLHEWWRLWKDHPEKWARGERYEEMTGYTFRAPGRDTWPVSMRGLREAFEAGRVPTRSLKLAEREAEEQRCRVCQG